MLDQTLAIDTTDAIPETLRDPAPEPSHLERAARLAQEMKRLVIGAQKAPLKAEVKAHIESLNVWADAYAAGLDAAQKLSDHAAATLTEAQAELAAALDQYIRFEGEGGNPAPSFQARQTEDLSRILSHISGLVGTLETTMKTSPVMADPEDLPPEPSPSIPPEEAPEVEPYSPPETNPQIQPPIPPVMDPMM